MIKVIYQAPAWRTVLCLFLFLTLATQPGLGALLEKGDLVFYNDQSIMRWRPGNAELITIASFSLSGSNGGIALDQAGTIYGLRNEGGMRLTRFDPDSGGFLPVTNEDLIAIGYLAIPSSDNQALLVSGENQQGASAIFRVDLATGQQTIAITDFQSTFMDLVPAVEEPAYMAFAPDGKLIVGDRDYAHVVEFNEDGSGRRLIKEIPYPFLLTGLAVNLQGEIFVCGVNVPEKILKVDRATGQTTPIGNGAFVDAPFGLAIGLDGELLVEDVGGDAIVRIDPVTGEESILVPEIRSPRTIWVHGYQSGGVPSPTLAVSLSNARIVLSWTGPSEWSLVESTTLHDPFSWSLVTAPETIDGENHSVELAVQSPQRWFRLRRD